MQKKKKKKKKNNYKRIGYDMDSVRDIACLLSYSVMVDIYAFLFDCITVGSALDLMSVQT